MYDREEFYQLVKKIPKGKVTTYNLLANALGFSTPRLAGRLLHENPTPITIPCHRVVNANGRLAKNFACGGIEKQRILLEDEGVETKNNKVDLSKYLWEPELKIETILRFGGIGVIPTDTIYGVVARAFDKEAVERLYRVKKRQLQKPFIILISNIEDLTNFNIKLNQEIIDILDKFWPGPVSVILPAVDADEHLTRGSFSLAFRLPKDGYLVKLLREVGPLVAPSANPEGFPPAKNIEEAKKYFNNKVNFYVDGGKLDCPASKIIEIKDGKIIYLRK